MGLALLWLPASEAALVAYTMPVWAALLAWPVLGEQPTLLRVIALVLAFGGLASIMGGNGITASQAKLPGHIDGADRRVRLCARHRAGEEISDPSAADHGCRLADRARLASDRDRRPCDRDHASRSRHAARLVAAGLCGGRPVLRRLSLLVRGAGAPACLGRRDRHHGGARHRRRGVGGRTARAARPGPARGACPDARRGGVGDALVGRSAG